jgi:predicted nucleic acid-binding protein
VIAVVTNERHRPELVKSTIGATLFAPPSLHWEVGNAFSAMFKRKAITWGQARKALAAYAKIPIRFSDVSLEEAVAISSEFGVYAYDAYMIQCARKHSAPLLTLDTGLADAARRAGIEVKGVG